MSVGIVFFMFLLSFIALILLSSLIPYAMFFLFILLPVFVVLLSFCKCKQCGGGFGLFLEKLNLKTGRCIACDSDDKLNKEK